MKTPETIVSRNTKVAWQRIEEKVVLVSPKTKKIHILHGSGGSVWDYLKEPKQISELVELICEEYDTNQEQAQKDLDSFLDQLEEEKVVVAQ